MIELRDGKKVEVNEGDLRVWWIPQVPMNNSFYVTVKSIDEAKLVLDCLANYDLWQLKYRIKPDYSNAGGLQRLEMTGDKLEWVEWYNDDDEDIDEVMKQ